MKLISILFIIINANASASWQKSHYVDQTQNEIKAISNKDLMGLKRGYGTPFGGMAKAAELNGLPGPRHVLDLKNELNLSQETVRKIDDIFHKMASQAKLLGQELIAIESKMDKNLKGNSLTQSDLKALVAASAKKYGELRYSHLAAHLETANVMTKKEIHRYNQLRGYNQPDTCKNIPKGHSKEMWKKHHGCHL